MRVTADVILERVRQAGTGSLSMRVNGVTSYALPASILTAMLMKMD